MTASDYASLEENTGKHLLDVMDGFVNQTIEEIVAQLSDKNEIKNILEKQIEERKGIYYTHDASFEAGFYFALNLAKTIINEQKKLYNI